MYAISIEPSTLALIAMLNGGVSPEIEEQDTLFIIDGPDTPPRIIASNKRDESLKNHTFILAAHQL